MKYRFAPYLALALAVLIAAAGYLRGVPIPILEPAGPVALAERNVIFITLALCSIVVVPVFVLLFYFAWKYRADSPEAHVHHRPDWDHDNLAFEFAWWLVPSAIIVVLGVIMWQSSHALDPYKPIQSAEAPLEIQVVALDWKWLFIYPEEGIASVNFLEVPKNTPIHFELTADAPMNSFWVPSLGGQIMVMPGMTTQLNLLANRPGDFDGFSANISGRGFSGMTFTVQSVSKSDFDRWVRSVRLTSGTPLDASSYQTLATPSENAPVSYYAPVESGLYTGVVMKFMEPQTSMNDTSLPSLTPASMSGMTMTQP